MGGGTYKLKLKTMNFPSKYLNSDLTPMFPKEEVPTCEKCGEEAGTKMAGDESVVYCRECNHITY